MAKSKNDYPKTFRPPLVFRIMSFVTTVFMVPFLIVFFSGIGFPTGVGILIGLVIFYFLSSFLWYLLEFSFRQAIEITPDGIWFHSYGKFFYPWDSMIGFGKKDGRYWGIVTKEPDIAYINVIAKWLFKPGHYQNFIPIDGIIRMQFLRTDLRKDTDKFRQQTGFGRELAYFAPHLFDTGKEKPKNRLRDDYADSDYDIVDTDKYQQEETRK